MTGNAFRARPHLVDTQPGFVRMEVLSPRDQSNEFWLITFWDCEDSFERWHRHHLNESHRFMPKGLKVEAGSRAMQFFDVVTE